MKRPDLECARMIAMVFSKQMFESPESICIAVEDLLNELQENNLIDTEEERSCICPNCGKYWDMDKNSGCSCGASIANWQPKK